MEELDSRIVEALKSQDPEERKKAVRALGQTTSSEALRYLATIYKKDPDEGVRNLAIKAGRHVKKMRAASDWVVNDDDIRFATSEQPVVSSTVSAAVQEQAKGLMDKALNESVKGDYDKAEGYARQAFQVNPDLQHDSYYVGIACDVMNMDSEEAVAALLTPPTE
ncbi:MAG: HEAT repeat domain-containing protein [Anaerolineae bacterium]|nr:HEAT repeat domain-containing protein [Anaerolineae bacterium]MDQ7037474.1 HEAT repeat domain-containing protein [Anaerolineae bacterium]